MGLTYLECARLKEAEEALRQALRLNPRNPTYLEWLSWVQFRRGDRAGALATVEQGLAINPQHVGCLNHRGQYKRVRGKWKDAEETLRTALTLNPESYLTHAQLAWALFTKAINRARADGQASSWPWRPEMAEAREHCQEALRLNPCSDFAKTTMTEILMAPWRIIFFAIGFVPGLAAFGALLILVMSSFHADRDLTPERLDMVKGVLLVNLGLVRVSFSNGPLYLLLLRSRVGQDVLSPSRRRAANGTMLCLAAAAFAAAAAAATPPPVACAALFLSLVLVQPLTDACQATPGWPKKIMISYCVLLIGTGLFCVAMLCAGDTVPLSPAVATLTAGVTAMSLFSWFLARKLELRMGRTQE